MEVKSDKEIIDYFRTNIFEAFSAYNAWKMISYSRSKSVVSAEMADKYTLIQNYYPSFFGTAERSFLVNFVLSVLHSFDKRDDSFSLFKVDKTKTEKFIIENQGVFDELKKLRNKLFAHRDEDASHNQYKIPSVVSLDIFFDKLIILYNELTSVTDSSSTVFSNAEDIKRQMELLFMNLYRGENVRLKEIDIEWMWEKDNKKASDVL